MSVGWKVCRNKEILSLLLNGVLLGEMEKPHVAPMLPKAREVSNYPFEPRYFVSQNENEELWEVNDRDSPTFQLFLRSASDINRI